MKPEDINWQGEDSVFLHNPDLPAEEKELLAKLQNELPEIPSCIWVLTSGSTSLNQYKWIALKKGAFLASAKAVNDHIESSSDDVWLSVLPSFHVGGLSVWARAHLSGAKVIEEVSSWDPHRYHHLLESKNITLSSLVPTQLYDLVHSGLKCPDSLRAIFVGGGALSESVYLQARDLGYPVLPTYGMTEVCSQIATASLESLNEHRFPDARILDHIEVQEGSNSVLEVKGQSLLTGIAYIEGQSLTYKEHPKNEWYPTDDVGDVHLGCIKVRGRKSELVKVLGELVSFPKLRSVLELLSHELEATLLPVPDPRKGHAVAMVFELDALKMNYLEVIKDFNERVAGFEKATQIYFVDEIPKTPLGKLKSEELKMLIGVL